MRLTNQRNCLHGEAVWCRSHCYSSPPKRRGVPSVSVYVHKRLPLSWQKCFHRLRKSEVLLVAQSAKKGNADSQQTDPDMADLSSISKDSLLTGQLCLCGVAILWGSYSPVVRYIYSCPGPPTPAALTAVRTVIQAIVLLISDAASQQQRLTSPSKVKARRSVPTPAVSKNDAYPAIFGSTFGWLSSALQSTSSKLWIAGAELGFWNFCGSTFQALGLQYTTATRGAFLIQVS